MSTPTTATSGGMFAHPGRASTRARQWLRATAWMLGAQLYLAFWFWCIVALAVTVALVVINRVGTIELSIMQFAAQGATWFPFATAIMLTTAQIGMHVVSGMTRRSFIRAALLSVVASALVYALAMSLALLAEGAVYDRFGWPHTAGEVGRAAWQDGFGPALLDFGLVFLAAQVSGLLVGIAYYRFGGWWGTLLLPLTVAPVYGSLLIADAAVAGWSGFELLTDPGVLAAARAVLVALGAYAFHRVTRDVPIRRVAA